MCTHSCAPARRRRAGLGLLLGALLGAWPASARADFVTLVSFTGVETADPTAGVIQDAQGNLYGAGENGGAYDYGTVFEVAAGTHAVTTLATFDGTNGSYPYGGVVRDGQGNLYGTAYDSPIGTGLPTGMVFKVAAGTNSITPVVRFENTTVAGHPNAGLVVDGQGNLYGTAGATIFEIPAGTSTLTTLATFTSSNGSAPNAGLLRDAQGNLYGTTNGVANVNSGTVFKYTAARHTLTTLASLPGVVSVYPNGDLIQDAQGNLYGTTTAGGVHSFGSVFEVRANGSPVTLSGDFDYSTRGRPKSGLVRDAQGNLYGTTGEAAGDVGGTLFELKAGSSTVTTVATLYPWWIDGTMNGELLQDAQGDIYGTTLQGGRYRNGSVFLLTAAAPEPGSLLLCGLGAAGMAAAYARRRRRLPTPAG